MTEAGRRPASVLLALARTTVENVVNRVIALDPESQRRCGELAEQRVRIEFVGLPLTLDLGFDAEGIRLLEGVESPDTTISGTPIAMLGLASGGGTDALFEGGVKIHGDTRTGKRLHRLINALEIDWEAQLARLTGDLVARKTGVLLRDLEQWRRRSTVSLAGDVGEYLQEETELLARRDEVDGLVDAIDTFTLDVDRLEARIKLLAART